MAGTSSQSGVEGLAGLLERIGKKEQEALAELYDRTGRLLFGLASKVLDDAEAAAQALLDTYTHIWRHSPASTAPDAPVQPLDWLVKTARTYAVARLVSSRRRRQPPATPSLDAPGTVAPAEQKVARFQLEALAPMQREVLNWAYFSGLSADEIAGRIGTPVGAVRAHVRMGLNRLGKTPEIHEPATGDEGAAS